MYYYTLISSHAAKILAKHVGQVGNLDSVGINRREVVNERVIQRKE